MVTVPYTFSAHPLLCLRGPWPLSPIFLPPKLTANLDSPSVGLYTDSVLALLGRHAFFMD